MAYHVFTYEDLSLSPWNKRHSQYNHRWIYYSRQQQGLGHLFDVDREVYRTNCTYCSHHHVNSLRALLSSNSFSIMILTDQMCQNHSHPWSLSHNNIFVCFWCDTLWSNCIISWAQFIRMLALNTPDISKGPWRLQCTLFNLESFGTWGKSGKIKC